jgi:CBS domain containing-hemolysin-like protein
MIVFLFIVAMLLLNALFVAAEFAVVAVPRTAMKKRAEAGQIRAEHILAIKEQPELQDQYIATSQLGITLASLGLGMYGEHALAEWLIHLSESSGTLSFLAAHSTASVVAVSILTYFHVVLGEMIPKTLALQKAESLILAIMPIMQGFRLVMYPLIVMLNAMGNGFLGLLGIQRSEARPFSTVRDIQFIVHESQEAGALGKDTANVLQELLGFTDTDAGELMVPRVHIAGLEINSTAETVRQLLMASPHSRYPVYREKIDDILGFVHVQDLYYCLQEAQYHAKQASAEDAAPAILDEEDLHSIPFLPATTALETVLQTLQREQVKMVILLDEFGGTAGLLSLEDIFSELAGPIDASDIYTAEIKEDHEENQWQMAGTVRLEELSETLDYAILHDEVETLSGLILDVLERTPRIGDEVEFGPLQLKVLSLQGRGVERCQVSFTPPEDDEN